jgi:hypothetical protein
MSRRRGAGRRSNAKRFLQPGPTRTYETPKLGARRSFGHVLDDQDGRLVLVRRFKKVIVVVSLQDGIQGEDREGTQP